MGDFPNIFMIDGIDRLGKSSLIKAILDNYGYHLVIHYDKPMVLKEHLELARELKAVPEAYRSEIDPAYLSQLHLSDENFARYIYQLECNDNMFALLKSDQRLIFDRTHLGECVYAPLYRGYPGDYVYDLERKLLDEVHLRTANNIRQILLTTSCFEMLTDDGLSFNFDNKEREQAQFIQAFKRSALPNKVIVDVHNGSKGYKSFEQVFDEAMNGQKIS